ncbi:MAG: shikimate kinase [Hyphomicrobiaceae bacterium]
MSKISSRARDRRATSPEIAQTIRRKLGARSLVMVGLMGCGKSTIGRRLANRLEIPFVDADDEIERSARKTIPEIFADHGEDYFRAGERRVISRLLDSGPRVLATGGGAYMNAETRATIRQNGIAIWLKAELDVLMRRVMKRDNRPLLQVADPEAVMRELMEKRYPVYAEAEIVVESRDVPHEVIVDAIVMALDNNPLLAG